MYQALTKQRFLQLLRQNIYQSSAAANRALGKARSLTDEEKDSCKRSVTRHFSPSKVTTMEKTATKKTPAKKTVKKAAKKTVAKKAVKKPAKKAAAKKPVKKAAKRVAKTPAAA